MRTRSPRRLAASLVVGLAGVASGAVAQLPSNSLPVPIVDQRILVGRYHYEEKHDGFAMDVMFNADHTASYAMKISESDGPTDAESKFALRGFWTVDDFTIHFHNKPGPVRLEPNGVPTRDASVGLNVTATLPDGSPAKGLGVTWVDADGVFIMTDGRNRTDRNVRIASKVYIMRAEDRKILQTLNIRPGGPNDFHFTYYPSDEEPFDIAAIMLDDRAQAIEMEVGTSQVQLKRVEPVK